MKAIYFLLLFIFAETVNCRAQKIERRAHQEVYDHHFDVDSANFFRIDTLYTWTTADQIEELRKDRKLLKRSRSPLNGFSLFDRALKDTSLAKDTGIQIVMEERFSKKRFAWSNGWATVRGWSGESYGHHLIQIVLKEEAIIAHLDYSEALWSDPKIDFYNRKGEEISSEYAKEHEDLIAMVFHENSIFEFSRKTWGRKKYGTYWTDRKRSIIHETGYPLREFVIVNEGMIKTWSYGTPAIKKEIQCEINFLRQHITYGKPKQKAFSSRASCWDGWLYKRSDPSNYYYSSMCFENDHYLYNKKAIQAIIDELEIALKEQGAEITK